MAINFLLINISTVVIFAFPQDLCCRRNFSGTNFCFGYDAKWKPLKNNRLYSNNKMNTFTNYTIIRCCKTTGIVKYRSLWYTYSDLQYTSIWQYINTVVEYYIVILCSMRNCYVVLSDACLMWHSGSVWVMCSTTPRFFKGIIMTYYFYLMDIMMQFRSKGSNMWCTEHTVSETLKTKLTKKVLILDFNVILKKHIKSFVSVISLW